MLVLSLFPGIGLLDRAFEEEGFTVVRGPDLLWGGDIRQFHVPAGKFDGVIGGPPCQAFSRMANIARARGQQVAESRIPEFERVVLESQPEWFLMENVPEAPIPAVAGYQVRDYTVNNRWVGGTQNRVRRFSFGTTDGRELSIEIVALEPAEFETAVTARGTRWDAEKKRPQSYRTAADLQRALIAQGLSPDYLDHAPFTAEGKMKVVGNGVPLPMGRAIARAVKQAIAAEAAQ
jgi:DNA (cytosine-5)-methyltransferase 1